MQKNYFLAVLVLIILGIGAFFIFAKQQPTTTSETDTTTGPVATTTETTTQTTAVKIALLDTTGSGSGKSRGCDTVSLVTRTVPATTAPLTSAMQALFVEPAGTQPSSTYNFIARTNKTLQFNHATVASGTANIYLTGSLSGLAGVCDDPRAQIQIEETALQFPTVQKVQIYLNNKATTLTPSEK